MKKALLALILLVGGSYVHAALRLSCNAGVIDGTSIHAVLNEWDISSNWYRLDSKHTKSNIVQLSLVWKGPKLTTTRHIAWHPELGVANEPYVIFGEKKQFKTLSVVSKKEIAIALLMTESERNIHINDCAQLPDALREHVGIRQSISAWAQRLSWGWPDGGPARWNKAFWNKGTPLRKEKTIESFADMFSKPQRYSVGCYTATKMVIVQGVLDYYHRIKKDPIKTQKVIDILWSDGDPLVGIEDRKMWAFEVDFDMTEVDKKGKLLKLEEAIGVDQFVPGDWSYFLNTDPLSYEKTGYEGSNAMYLGGNRFNDHYNDNNGHYLFNEKIRMVWNWRNGVFSRSGDYDKVEFIDAIRIDQLSAPPKKGGFLFAFRASPKSIEP